MAGLGVTNCCIKAGVSRSVLHMQTTNSKVDAEFATKDFQFWNRELDQLIAGLRTDADFLDAHNEYAGGTLMRMRADRIEETLANVREAQTKL